MQKFAAAATAVMLLIALTGCGGTVPGDPTAAGTEPQAIVPSQNTAAKSTKLTVNDLVSRLTAAGIKVKSVGGWVGWRTHAIGMNLTSGYPCRSS